jgi:hypothetical protein
MKTHDDLNAEELIDLLNRCWMTHDGMWFYHCLQEFGIEKTNQLNKAAIRGLAPFEISRMNKAFAKQERINSFQAFRDFFTRAGQVFIPPFMNAAMSFPGENILHWEFAPHNCFAYKGIKRIGVIDQYECGVIYRIECWLENLGITYRITPQVVGCLMHKNGTCEGCIELSFEKEKPNFDR